MASKWICRKLPLIILNRNLKPAVSLKLVRFQNNSAERAKKGLPIRLPIAGVDHVIVVASGKGGVGKSTTAVNLALAIQAVEENATVGLLDADVFGPSIPIMMNLKGSPEITKQKLMKPLMNYGIKCMSMGFLINENAAVVWRGLMVMSAMQKLLRQVAWGPLNYLVIDMPPGTGDTQLSICQNIPLSGAVIVTTPQDLSLIDARRAIEMFNKVNVPIIGIVENMSSFICPHCTKISKIFGEEGANILSNEVNVDILGQMPLEMEIRALCDSGKPVVVTKPNSPQTQEYKNIAKNVLEKIKS